MMHVGMYIGLGHVFSSHELCCCVSSVCVVSDSAKGRTERERVCEQDDVRRRKCTNDDSERQHADDSSATRGRVG